MKKTKSNGHCWNPGDCNYCENFSNQVKNLEEMDRFLDIHELSKLNQEDKKNFFE